MSFDLLNIQWSNRHEALQPSAVVAFDTSALAVAVKLLSFDEERLQKLQGVAAEKMILLLGEAEALPWTDGIVYLGRDASMPSILMPTTLRPNIPLDLFRRVLNENFKQFAPLAVVPGKMISFGKARILSSRILQNWLATNR